MINTYRVAPRLSLRETMLTAMFVRFEQEKKRDQKALCEVEYV